MTRNTGHDNKLHPGPVHPRPSLSKFSGSPSRNKKKTPSTLPGEKQQFR